MEGVLFILLQIAIVFGFREYIKNGVKHQFDKELEGYKDELQRNLKEHEQKLQLATEEAKLDITRRAQDFGLYTQKRHETYIKLHQLFTEAQSRVFGRRGLKSIPDYKRYSKQEIQEWLEDGDFVHQDVDSVLSIWDADRDLGVKKIIDLRKLWERSQASRGIGEANNFFVESQLYMSRPAIELSGGLLKLLSELRGLYELEDDMGPIQDHPTASELKLQINDALEKLTLVMRTELKKGYYPEEDEVKTSDN